MFYFFKKQVRLFVAVLISTFLLTACNNDKNSSLILEGVNESLERSNEEVSRSTKNYLEGLKQKSEQPETAERAREWKPKADSIHKVTQQLIDYLKRKEVVKINLNAKVDLGEELSNELLDYKIKVLRYDTKLQMEFENKLSGFNRKFIQQINRVADSNKVKSFFLKLENDVRRNETELIEYCFNQIGCVDCDALFDKYQTIVSQNQSVFVKGEILKIKAGVGAFSISRIPKVIINEKNLNTDAGYGEYMMKVNDKPGRYKVPVRILFKGNDGKEIVIDDFAEYTVVDK